MTHPRLSLASISALLTLTVATSLAQSTGDYRSKAPGNWNSTATWETYNGSTWVAATSTPTSSDGVIKIRTGHTVTLTADVTIDQTIIETGGQITVASGKTLTIADLDVSGTVVNQGTVAVTGAEPTLTLGSGSTFVHNTTSEISGVLDVASVDAGSTVEYKDSGVPSLANRTYGTLKLTTAGSKTYTSDASTDPLVVLSDLVIGSGVTWNSGNFAGDITVDGNTTISGTWTGSGSGDLGTHTFGYGTFIVNSGGSYSLATTGTTQGPIQFQGDLVNNGTFTAPSNRSVYFSSEGSLSMSGTSPIVFNNGFTSYSPVTIAPGATVQVAAGKALEIQSDLTLERESASSYATISGSGSLMFRGHNNTLTNNGAISASTTFVNVEGGQYYVAGDGTWGSVLIEPSVEVKLSGNVEMENVNLTIAGYGALNTQWNTLLLKGTSAVNVEVQPSASITGGGVTVQTQGTVNIVQNGTFEEALQVMGGTTTTSGLFLQPIIVKPFGTLNIPTGTLTARSGVTVERELPVAPKLGETASSASANRGANPSLLTTIAKGTISGGGNLVFDGYEKTFTNNGIVNVATTFENNDGDVKHMDGDGAGLWKSVTIAAGCSTSVCSGHTFTGAGTPFLVNGSVYLDPTSTIVYGGSSSQTVAPLTYNNLEINNSSSDVALGGSMTVDGALTIFSRNLTTGADTLTLGSFATITETAPYSVLGNLTTARVCSTGVNETFGGMGVEINAAGAWPGTTTVTRVTGTAPTFPPGIPVKRYFDITPTTNTGLNATFVYRYFDNELNGNTESGIQLYNSTDAGSTWSAKGGTVNTSLNTITLTGVGQFSRWIAGGTGNPAPSLSSVSPASVGLGATLDVVVTGTGFANGISTPSFGGDITVNSFTVNTPTQITANITVSSSASLGARNVSVTNVPPGGGTGTLTNGLTLEYPPPGIGSITPNSASRGQTLAVTIIGEGYFSGVTGVNFGPNVIVNSLIVTGVTQLTANITIGVAASTGLRSVTVSNSSPGGGSTTWENAFTIANPAPTLTRVEPAAADRGTDMTVVLHGSNFLSGVSRVGFGPGIIVRSTTVESSTQMRVNLTIGMGAATGPRDVTVTNPSPGGGTATLPSGFMVGNPGPTISDMSPSSGSRGQTMAVTFNGTGFLVGVTSVTFGPGITVNSVAVSSSMQMKANITIALDAPTGSSDVSVTNPEPGGGTVRLTGASAVVNPAPTLATMSPASGNRGQTLSVTVTGTNFIPGVTTPAYGSGITVNSVSSFTSTQVTASVTIDIGATPGPRDITVTNAAPGGGTATLSGAFTVNNPSPTLSSVSPTRAGRGSSINVVLTGTNFLEGVSSVSFGSDVTVNSTTITSATQIKVNISIALSAATGARNVSVTNATPGGGTATLTGGFTVDTSPATGIENTLSAIPEEYVLQEAYPNPFNPSTRIRYGLPEQSRVKLEVYNMLGNVVAELVSGERSKGLYEVEWRAENQPSGVYLVRVFSESVETSKRFIASRKVVLVK